MSTIEDFVQASLDQDYNRANEIFGDIMGSKMSDTLEQEKIRIANSIYNDTDDFDEDDLDDDDLDDDDFDDDYLDDDDFDDDDDDDDELSS